MYSCGAVQTIFITEGKTNIEVPNPKAFRTKSGDYAPSLTLVFYNPLMEFCRDISVSVAQTIAKKTKDIRICDPLAGVGVRGVRYAKEVKGVSMVIANDRSLESYEMLKRNIELNKVTHLVEARSVDANILLMENRRGFDFVDVDPFGSPAPFVDAACGSLGRRGMLALTATDTAPLSGTHPRTCIRRYGAKPLNTEYCHELGIRILIGFAQRVAGKHEIALTPVLAHATIHYFRVYLEAQRGAKCADDVLEGLGYVSHCSSCGGRILTQGFAPELPGVCACGGRFSHAGPLWLGTIIDSRFAKEVAVDLARRSFKLGYKELQLLNRCVEEAEGPPTYYDLNALSGRAGVSSPKIVQAIAKLRGAGYFASRTHFLNNGLRTNAPINEILDIVRGSGSH